MLSLSIRKPGGLHQLTKMRQIWLLLAVAMLVMMAGCDESITGSVVKNTTVTDEFDYSKFVDELMENPLINIKVIDDSGKVHYYNIDLRVGVVNEGSLRDVDLVITMTASELQDISSKPNIVEYFIDLIRDGSVGMTR